MGKLRLGIETASNPPEQGKAAEAVRVAIQSGQQTAELGEDPRVTAALVSLEELRVRPQK